MVRLHWPQVMLLLKARDQVIENWSAQNPDRDTLEDRRLEAASQAEIAIEAQNRRSQGRPRCEDAHDRLRLARPGRP